ncbi:MAG: hypothetical protein AUG51_19895 [Acidobacteria bacterium 13_1_20CM_3_53_8]|nr:MAG: hypothetical protein AUG51_19895 [Acidobacteria bacterium 13_1_20CM_3_53_8]
MVIEPHLLRMNPMNEIEQKERLTRQYLLGELDKAEREQFEVRFITDPVFRDAVLMVEDELIEDYVVGRLSASEREKFAKNYLTTPHQVQKLRITKALSERADEHFAPHSYSSASTAQETFARLRDFFKDLRAWKARRLALASLILLALTMLFLIVLLRRNDPRNALYQELVELNTQPSNVNTSPAMRSPMFTVTLAPVLVREVGEAKSFSIPAGASVVQLRLNGVIGGYRSYQAVLRTDEGEVFTLSGLRANNTNDGRQVIINVPTKFFQRRDYQLKLSGLADSGQYEAIADYTFRVSGVT